MSHIVGIDLGTTNSLCAVFQDGEPRLIPNVHGDVLTPSVVGFLDDGQLIVGAAARELAVTRPDQCVARFKRWMGTDQSTKLAGKSYTPPELSSLILRSLKTDAEQHLGEPITEAVITVPAYFNDHQRTATKQAGELAGLKVRRIINEPTAAALTYGFHEPQSMKHLLVIDLGGGTFDVTLMEIFEGSLEIVSTAGVNFLGGEDFTDRVVTAALRQLGMQFEQAEMQKPLLVARLRQLCEVAKRELGTSDSVTVSIPNDEGILEKDAKRIKISRQAVTKLCQPLLDRLTNPIHKAMRDGGRGPDEIDETILVGGATRMPWLVGELETKLHLEPKCRFNPDEVVALGAAIQAALIKDDKAVEDIVMTDVCPYTLGVEVVKDFGQRLRDGYFQPIIHRNTTIPVSREETFYTVTENQSEVNICVYQGESRRVEQNHQLGELTVDGIPPGPAGKPVVIRFTFDINGILEVESFVEGSGKKFNTILTQHAGSMSEEELKAAIARLSKIKFYPRDDEQNRRLVLLTERAIGEVNPMFRERLEQALDTFEASMQSGDKELFEATRTGLLTTLSSLGIEIE